jgi:hypothetical protein
MRFLSRNSAYSALPHFFMVNLVVSLIATFEKLNLGSYGFRFFDDGILQNRPLIAVFLNCPMLLARILSKVFSVFCRDTSSKAAVYFLAVDIAASCEPFLHFETLTISYSSVSNYRTFYSRISSKVSFKYVYFVLSSIQPNFCRWLRSCLATYTEVYFFLSLLLFI